MIIDFHTHVFPDTLAPSAVRTLEKVGGIKAAGDGTVSGLLRSMDRAGIDKSVIAPVSTKPGQVVAINDWIMGLNDDRLVSFGTLFPGMDKYDDEVRRLAGAGIRGVKLHPDYQDFFVDDERVFPLYEACREYRLIILFHAGIDIGLPEPVHGTPEALARVHERFPGLRIVAAHMGGHLMWDDVERSLVGKEVYFDMAYFRSDLTEERFRAILDRHDTERILFASDYPWLGQDLAVEAFERWQLPGEVRKRIYVGNAATLLDIDADSPQTCRNRPDTP